MTPSSSAKKVAKLASRGKGRRVRFQGGAVFPIAVALVVLLGLLAIVYGRQSRPSDGSGVPRVNDGTNTDAHWHIAYGIYVCDTFQPKLTGTKEETGIDATLYRLTDWQLQNQFEIFKQRRSCFAPGITHNLEHVFGLTVPECLDISLAPSEHTACRWLPWREAAASCLSWSNRDAILLLPERRAVHN